MLVRFSVSNFLSFKETTEFNMLTGSPRRLEHHVYEPAKDVALLKMAALYGANGAGKSNLAKAMVFLRDLVAKGWLSPAPLQFKLQSNPQALPTSFEVEFLSGAASFTYGVDLSASQVLEEWLYRTFPDKEDDLIFHRRSNKGGTIIDTAKAFVQTEEQRLRIRLYEKELLGPTDLFLQKLGVTKAEFGPVQEVYQWFTQYWTIIFPQSKAKGIIRDLALLTGFFEFAKELMCTFHTGIVSLEIETHDLEVFFGKDDLEQVAQVKADLSAAESSGAHLVVSSINEEVLVTTENGRPVVKRLVAKHESGESGSVPFLLWQESDGTQRLLDLMPVLYRAVRIGGVVVIDEIEQAIHPALLKSLIAKFAQDEQTMGQLIFTTHEAHLLDQEFMRSDEFWFAEKSPEGTTTLTPLSDFKDVRYDLDLRKGYLMGRFGAIPFTGDLRQLNWDAHAEAKRQ